MLATVVVMVQVAQCIQKKPGVCAQCLNGAYDTPEDIATSVPPHDKIDNAKKGKTRTMHRSG